ncbi:MAG: hypothetical protein NTY35_11190 [Planctomycetota bacterium]|nr:hypothetical protein [Planctomycetota bacterium]
MARLSAGSWVVTPGETGPFTDLAVLDVGSGPQLFGLGQFAGFGWPDVARWNGSGWTRLNAPPGTPLALGVHDFGSGPRLVISSSLSGASGELHAYDGASWQTLPGTFTTASAPNGVALALRSFDDGSGPRLFAAGSFTAVGGVGAGHFASFDGTTWYGGVTGLDGSVNAFLAHDDGSGRALYVGGGFASIDARTDLRGIARWDGTGWSAVGGGIANGGVLALAAPDLGSGRQLIAGGAFSASAGNAGASIQRWTGSSWQPLGSGVQMDLGTTATVSALCEYDDGSGNALYVAGRFDRAGGVVRRGIARWNGTSWSTVGAGGVAGDFPRVNALAVFDDGGGPKLYAAGIFSSIGDEPAAGIAKWNGGHWSAVSPGVMSASDVIFTLATHDDGNGTQLYVGGAFNQVAGFPARSIARWNGSTWSTLGGGGFVNSVHVLRSGHTDSGPALFVGGFAVQPGGPAGPSMLSSWNGAWSNLALTGQNGGSVYAVVDHDDGTTRALYAGGQFTVSPSGDSNLMRRGCPSDTAFQVFCAGDGSATACPCANSGATGRGCANSVDGAGALLGHSGTASVGNADLVLAGSGMPNAACLYVQGTTQQNGGAGVVFGDGLRCAGGTLTRLGVRINSSNGSSLPGPGEPSIAQRGGIPAGGGVTRYYQIWYRNSASFCAPTSFNLSNGLSVDWGV